MCDWTFKNLAWIVCKFTAALLLLSAGGCALATWINPRSFYYHQLFVMLWLHDEGEKVYLFFKHLRCKGIYSVFISCQFALVPSIFYVLLLNRCDLWQSCLSRRQFTPKDWSWPTGHWRAQSCLVVFISIYIYIIAADELQRWHFVSVKKIIIQHHIIGFIDYFY